MPTFVQPAPPRAIVSEETEGVRISIPSKRSWGRLFLAAWLCGWTVAGVSAARSLQHHFNLFLCFWLVGWFLGELAASCAILYMLGGCEVVLANSERLSCTTEIFGLGFAKSYLVREMRDLRFQPASGVGKGLRASRIAFDYGAKTIPFGADIEEAEATELISRIRQRCAIVEASPAPAAGIKFWQPRSPWNPHFAC
jgi:hypothetical protein